MNIFPKSSLFIGVGLVLAIAIIAFLEFAHVYRFVRRERAITAICVPVAVGQTHLYFRIPQGHYFGFFTDAPNMDKNIFEPRSKPSGIDLASIKIASRTNTLEISDYGEFMFDIHPEEEFQPAELVVFSIAGNRVWYLNLKSGM
jgi:hypothetical protein